MVIMRISSTIRRPILFDTMIILFAHDFMICSMPVQFDATTTRAEPAFHELYQVIISKEHIGGVI